MRPVLHDPPKEFRREAPERREAPARAAPPVVRLRRQHQRESIEVAVAVARPAARVDHLLDIRVFCLGGELGAGAQEEGVDAGSLIQLIDVATERILNSSYIHSRLL